MRKNERIKKKRRKNITNKCERTRIANIHPIASMAIQDKT